MEPGKPGREKRTPYVLLGMLLQGPASGYALRQRIAQSVGNFWQESYGQLYPALQTLADNGLVEASDKAKDGRATRVWRITKAGRAALKAWLDHPPTPQRERNELLLKLYFAELAPAAVKRHVEGAREEAGRELARLKQLRDEVAGRAPEHPSLPLWLATIDYGIEGQEALLRWCAGALPALDPPAPSRKRARRSRDRGCP